MSEKRRELSRRNLLKLGAVAGTLGVTGQARITRAGDDEKASENRAGVGKDMYQRQCGNGDIILP